MKLFLFVTAICATVMQDILAIGQTPRGNYANKTLSRSYIQQQFEAAGLQFKAVEYTRSPDLIQEALDYVHQCLQTQDSHCLNIFADVLADGFDFKSDPQKRRRLADKIKLALIDGDFKVVDKLFKQLEKLVTFEQWPVVNLIGTTKQYLLNIPVYIVCAHYDSISGTQGFFDNAAGVAAMLKVARNYRPTQQAEVHFIAFDLEELGIAGSTFYLNSLTPLERQRIKGVINFDSIGAYSISPDTQQLPDGFDMIFPQQVKLIKDNHYKANFIAVLSDASSSELGDIFIQSANSIGIPSQPTEDLWVSLFVSPFNHMEHCQKISDMCRSEQYAFYQFNISTIHVTDTANLRSACYHQNCDNTLNDMNIKFIENVADVAVQTLQELSRPLKFNVQ